MLRNLVVGCLCVVTVASCQARESGSGSADSGAADQGTSESTDAGPGPEYWGPYRVPAYVSVDTCPLREGMTLRARAELAVRPCRTESGPVDLHIDSANARVILDAVTWNLGGVECAPPSEPLYGVRWVSISGLDAGRDGRTWTLAAMSGGNEIEVTVLPPGDTPRCDAEKKVDEACSADCECAADLVCVAGEHSCEPRCIMPCTERRDCPDHFACSEGECRQLVDYECGESTPCPQGMLCMGQAGGQQCYFDPKLDEDAGKPCVSNGDCSHGLDCVNLPPDHNLTCEYRCATANMRCPGDRFCRGEQWVCAPSPKTVTAGEAGIGDSGG